LVAVCVRPLPFRDFSEAIMKAIFSMTLVLGVCGFAGAADKVNPVGTWNCEYEIGGMKLTATLTIKKDGDKLAGAMSWPDQKDEKLKDVKLKESTLTFSAVRKFMGNEFPLDSRLRLKGTSSRGQARRNSGARSRSSTSKGSGRRRTSSGWPVLNSVVATLSQTLHLTVAAFRGSTALPRPRQVSYGVLPPVFGGISSPLMCFHVRDAAWDRGRPDFGLRRRIDDRKLLPSGPFYFDDPKPT
jgi:hypothetical protein